MRHWNSGGSNWFSKFNRSVSLEVFRKRWVVSGCSTQFAFWRWARSLVDFDLIIKIARTFLVVETLHRPIIPSSAIYPTIRES